MKPVYFRVPIYVVQRRGADFVSRNTLILVLRVCNLGTFRAKKTRRKAAR